MTDYNMTQGGNNQQLQNGKGLLDTAVELKKEFINLDSELLSFAGSVIKAHGFSTSNVIPVTCQNFLPDQTARQPISDPTGDSYLGFLGIGASDYNGVVVTLKTLDGLLDYYKSIGIITDETKVIEVNPKLGHDSYKGYPDTSPLECLIRDGQARKQLADLNKDGNLIFVATFLTDFMRSSLEDLGLKFVQHANPFITNNKELFHSNVKCSLMPSVLINKHDDLLSAISLLRDSILKKDISENGSTVAWLKLSGGSGGDFVQKIVVSNDEVMSPYLDGILVDKLLGAIQIIKNSVRQAFINNDYGKGALESFWLENNISPNDSALLLEQDARIEGEIIANASNLMLINSNGTFEIIGNYRQITGENGDYIGSQPFDPMTEFSEFADNLYGNMEAIKDYAVANKHYGYAGVDYFVVRKPDGEIKFVMTELNARIPISGTAHIIAQKLGASAWINVNLEASQAIKSMDDFHKYYGDAVLNENDAKLLQCSKLNSCKLVPQAFRTMQDNSGHIVPSRKFKALIVGPDMESCLSFLEELRRAN